MVAARAAGLRVVVVDAGVDGRRCAGAETIRPAEARGDLALTDALRQGDAAVLVELGKKLGFRLAAEGLIALGEVGIGNTTPAAALAAALLD